MSEQPDLSTLPKRMRYAADVMDEAKKRLDVEIYGKAQAGVRGDWHSDALRKRADIWGAEDHKLASRREDLARAIAAARGLSFDRAAEDVQKQYLLDAVYLIALGWRKTEDDNS